MMYEVVRVSGISRSWLAGTIPEIPETRKTSYMLKDLKQLPVKNALVAG